MGDRGNIVIRSSQSNRDDVWFYGHWSGSGLKSIVQNALSKRWRWSDPSYLARIVFDEMTKDSHGEETGFGISTQLQDNEYPVMVVDQANQRVYEAPESAIEEFRLPDNYEPKESRTFEEFIAQKADQAK